MAISVVEVVILVGCFLVAVYLWARRSRGEPTVISMEIPLNLSLDPGIYSGSGAFHAFINHLVEKCLSLYRRFTLNEILATPRYLELLEEIRSMLQYKRLGLNGLLASNPRVARKINQTEIKDDPIRAIARYFIQKENERDESIESMVFLGKEMVGLMMRNLRKHVNEFRLMNKHFV